MKKLTVLLLLIASVAASLTAQTRYLQPVFNSGVTKNANVIYGVNATVLYYSVLGQAVPQPLVMDIYQPVGDTETSRPVVLLFHTGNFLPFFNPSNPTQGGFNGACGGTTVDSSLVELAHRLCSMGYVVASVDYRLGWNPLAPTDVDRRYGLINAAYRGVQDARTAIRYFRKTVAEGGNPWGIDPEKIVIWGQGTGGYITLNTTTLDNYLKIPTASGGKFVWDHDQNPGTPPIPMVIEQVNGDIYGTSVGQVPNAAAPGGLDTLCYPNHVGYSSDFALSVNMAGAVGDSTWISPGQPPMISFHVPTDNFAPYNEGIVNVPGTPLQVVRVVGSYFAQQKFEANGNNTSFVDAGVVFDLTAEQELAFANSPLLQPGNVDVSDPTPGLYPFLQPGNPPATTSPWEWTAFVPAAPATCNNVKAEAIPYIDTIVRFYAPRACFALGLQECIDAVVGAKEPLAQNIALNAAPNPASSEIRLTSEIEHPMLGIQVFDRTGRLVQMHNNLNTNNFTVLRNNLNPGLYVIKVSFKEGFMTKIVTFE
ncbi:MAG: T9SS type A sorting domain-containing protein [Saprospiraceae bacterium]|nr:T9SS type A sorting domain-containing protein [Saprospiraceae bacterium]